MTSIRRNSPESWHQANAESEVFHDFFRPAYHVAFAPVVASSLAFQSRVLRKRVVRVLVVGGGKGVFTQKVLPASLKLFKPLPPKIEVVETDPSEVLSHAPKTAHRIRADARALPFKDGSFDLAFGESMIHHQGASGVMDIVREVGRVLKPDGMFLHVQDVVPTYQHWIVPRESIPTESDSIDARNRLLDAVHRRVLQAIGEAADENKMRFSPHLISGEARLKLKELVRKYGVGKDKAKLNSFTFLAGRAISSFDASLPKESALLRYRGYLAIASKYGKLKRFIAYADKNFRAHLTRAKG